MDRVDGIVEQWRIERPDLEVATIGLFGRMARLDFHVRRALESSLAAYGLNLSGFDVLATLRRAGSPYALSPCEIMDSTMISSGAVTNRIDQLEKSGLVARETNPRDRRGAVVSLTPSGLAKVEAALQAYVRTQARLVAVLEEGELRAFDGLLRKLLDPFDGPY